jgi:hypothetical protein
MMIALQLSLTVLDWAALGFLALLLILMCFGIHGLRQEIRDAARIEAEPRKGMALVPTPESR